MKRLHLLVLTCILTVLAFVAGAINPTHAKADTIQLCNPKCPTGQHCYLIIVEGGPIDTFCK